MRIRCIQWTTLFVCIMLMASTLAGCFGGHDQDSDNSFGKNGKPYAGTSITAYMGVSPAADVIRSMLPEFESQTGLKVNLQILANEQLSQKLSVQLTAGSSNPDVFMIRPLEEVKLFHKNGWVQPLDEYVRRNPDYDFDDFSKSAIESTTADGKLISVPLSTEQQILYYRKDLLEQAGIPVPKTLDELEEAVKKLHDPDNGVYGFVARGQRNALVTQLSSFLYSEGADFQKDGKATINTPEAIKGISRYANLLKNYGPPGVLNMAWPQAMGVFAQGKAAFFTDASAIYSSMLDPGTSKIVNKVGFAMFPAGQAGAKPFNITAWGMAMNSASANKEAAWTFIEWATGKDLVLKSQQRGNPGARNSVWNDPQGVSGFPEEYIPVISESIQVGVGHDRPQVISVSEARDIIGDIVIKGLLGEDIKDAADKANQAYQAIIDREKAK
ncbi:ABC transporter substrate-binding protein [Paenibacillus naphthalenovorans]|uniref:ABC transporter substrate-binding protein n=1 Tax=Paenibacillus naphthalenovorans TaxID=162209 RepID=UPI003D2B088F